MTVASYNDHLKEEIVGKRKWDEFLTLVRMLHLEECVLNEHDDIHGNHE